MMRKIKVRWATSRYRLGKDDGIRVRMEVVCATGLPERIFAYRMLPKNPATGSKRGHFSHVCSPVDLEDYPEDAPIQTHVPPWFRLSFVDLLLRSETESVAFIEDVRADIRRLLRSLAAVDEVFFTGEDDFFTGIQCSSSGSSASSAGETSSSSGSSVSLGPVQSLTATGTLARGAGTGLPWLIDAPAGGHVALLSGMVSRQLLIQGFDFDSLPADAVLEGFRVRLRARDTARAGSSSSASASDSSLSSASEAPNLAPLLMYLRLYDPDRGFVGDDKANNRPFLGPAWQNLRFGGPADLWNAGISVRMLRTRGDFGLGLIVFLPEEATPTEVAVDLAEITVFYR